MKKSFILISLLLVCAYSFSQSEKKIRELGISSKKTYYIDFEDSNGDESLESVEKYDNNGLLIEELINDKNGKFKSHYKYEYNEKGKLIKETRLLSNGKIKKSIEYKYNDKGLKTEKIVYDSKSIIISKKRYDYSF